jgi:hypothetical protein
VTGDARAVRDRHLDHVHVALHAAGPPARMGLPRLPPPRGPGGGLLGVGDLAIERGVLTGLRVRIDHLTGAALGEQRLEQQGDLPRVQALRVTADPLTPQLDHEQLELAIFHEDRVERREQEVPRLVHLALREQGVRGLADR